MNTSTSSTAKCGTCDTTTVTYHYGCPYMYQCGKKACELTGVCPGGYRQSYEMYQPCYPMWCSTTCSTTNTANTGNKQ